MVDNLHIIQKMIFLAYFVATHTFMQSFSDFLYSIVQLNGQSHVVL